MILYPEVWLYLLIWLLQGIHFPSSWHVYMYRCVHEHLPWVLVHAAVIPAVRVIAWALLFFTDIVSNAHVCQSLVIDQFNSQTTDCSNPHQDLGPIEIWFLWSGAPLFLCAVDKPAIIFLPNHASGQPKDRHSDKCIWTTGAPCSSWSKWPCIYMAWSKRVMLCRFYSWTKNNFVIRNHTTVAVREDCWLVVWTSTVYKTIC